jgi:formylmethanofuran dehydrogenase subunit E
MNDQAGGILKDNSLENPTITTNDDSKLNQDNMSVETITEISKSSSQTPSSSRRPSTRSLRKAQRTRRIPADQSRAAKLRLCSKCNESFPNMSTVPGNNLFLCSVCR